MFSFNKYNIKYLIPKLNIKKTLKCDLCDYEDLIEKNNKSNFFIIHLKTRDEIHCYDSEKCIIRQYEKYFNQ